MHGSRIFTALVFASVALFAGPAPVNAQSATDKMQDKATATAQDAKVGATDSWLTAKAKIALFADERVKSAQIHVETVKGAMSLRGKVDSDETKAAAGSIAQAVDGVRSVRNDLQVVPPGERKVVDSSDKDITRQVEGRLKRDGRLKKVDVRTDAGAVILTGAVPGIGASANASELARGVPGVRLVRNELTYDGARMGSAGPRAQVRAMQRALRDKGFDPGVTDGVMGPKTAEALRAYQKSEKLPETGAMDGNTGAKLGVKVSTR